MRTRHEIYRSIADITAGDLRFLAQNIGQIRPVLLRLFQEETYTAGKVAPLFEGLYHATLVGSHSELVFKCYQVHELIRGK